MSQGPADSEPEAKLLHTKRLYRAVVEAVHKLDVIISNKTAYREVFKPENISLRNKLRELCVKLMFLHPVDYGRKAEEVLWRKVYYDVIQLIKTNKKHIHSRSALECAYRTHLIGGIGFYQHLLLYIQSHYQLELQGCIDWTHVTDPLIGRKKPVLASGKEMEWAQMACHRCLVYLGDLARYQNELAGVDTDQLSERFYCQAVSVAPTVGMPFNQLGTLAGSKYYNVEATYYYLRCIQSGLPFEGAYGNLKRLFEKAVKMYHQIRRCETRKLPTSKQRSRDIKRLLVSFMYLQSLLQPKSSSADSELTTLCQSVLEDFNLCLFYLPSPSNLNMAAEEEEEYESRYAFLPDPLIFRMVIICLMNVHSLRQTGSKQYSAAIAFTLALFSHLINHVNIRLQVELEDSGNPVPSFQNDHPDDPEVQEASHVTEKESGEKIHNGDLGSRVQGKRRKKSKKLSRLSRLRRRRPPHKDDESDLSEGFDSDSSGGLGKESENSESGSEKSEEEGETAFDLESDSDMNSQESRSDLEDIEEEEEDPPGDGVPARTKKESAPSAKNSGKGAEPKSNGPPKSENPDCTVNGAGSEANIASNLQAMSTQMFQTKRCFRLAPTFSNVLQKPKSEPPICPPPTVEKPALNGELQMPSTAEQDAGSDSEASVTSSKSSKNEKTIQERLDILTNEGLLPTVKVFLDWLRTNTDIIVMCAQSSQSLWNRLSVLLNLLPAGSELQEAGISLCPAVRELVSFCEQPNLPVALLLAEDVALRNLPTMKNTHKKLNFEQDRSMLTPLEESIVRICYIRSFGHFLTCLQGNVLHFNPQLEIFISIAQSEPENLKQQTEAQFRMAEEEARRNRLMRDMAQLRLQLEVSQLEGSLQQPKTQTAMSPYLVPDTQALSQHLNVIRQLAASGRFIIIIPRAVIDGLDFLKKENAGARDGIRYLETEFKKGNRYIRCQRDTGKSFERHKLKRQDIDAWHLYKILDSCRQLTVSQGSGEEDTSGMVTILTGLQVEDPGLFSANMQAAFQAAASKGIEIQNILEFYKQWKEMG
ncbi:nonsense-mediated mRNA decay factor SMG5 isoform X2 [Latimeria chalumnae]|uniref:nonsense-mediated mRNA decay factor SMG5 isoform X2 n=1 Tax=Latimeria chalumnae TaxID=7897 RepID=UPI00313AFA20